MLRLCAMPVAFALFNAAASAAPVSAAISIDGQAARPVPLGPLTTPTGAYPIFDLGKVDGGRAYLIVDAADAAAHDVCIARFPAGTELDERAYRVTMGREAETVSALPGSVKCLGSSLPSARPDMARLRQALAAKRVVSYSRAAFSGWPRLPQLALEPLPGAEAYRPGRIYWRGSVYDKTFGNVSGSAGEANSSRGFVSGDDAVLIAAAAAGNSKAFAKAAERGRVQMLYGLSLPYLAIWSPGNHSLRDPQRPLPGDRPYRTEGGAWTGDDYGSYGKWCAPADYPYLGEVKAEAGKCYGHARNEAHLFNHGYAYWLATGDPRAALLQQAIAAYTWASNYRRAPGKYMPRFGYQRTTLNQFSAMWKLRDVAQNASGPLLWNRSRTSKMVGELWSGWNEGIAQIDRGKDPASRMAAAIYAYDRTEAFSDFMAQAYGAEPAYLWASAEHPELLQRLARHFVIRARDIGGTRGLDRTTGSSILRIDGSATTRAEIVDAINQRTSEPTDSFDGGQLHYILRAYWLLRMADDAAKRGWMPPVAGVPEAIARMEAARDATQKWKYLKLAGWKHAAVPFDAGR